MARTVQLACAHCGHLQTYVVESTENAVEVAEVERASDDCDPIAKDSAAMRLRRLESLPTSLPVGGIITPV